MRFIDNVKKRLKFSIDLDINPDVLSALSVLLSLLVFANPIAALIIVLFIDAIDGAIARGSGRGGGPLVDWSCDRFSEFIVFGYLAYAINPIILILPVMNVLINYRVMKRSKPAIYVLPLRHALLAVLVVTYVIPFL